MCFSNFLLEILEENFKSKRNYFIFNIYFMSMRVLPAHNCTPECSAWGSQKRALGPPGPELQVVVNYQVDAGNRIRVLGKAINISSAGSSVYYFFLLDWLLYHCCFDFLWLLIVFILPRLFLKSWVHMTLMPQLCRVLLIFLR